jgi:myosin heavy subunit
MDVLGFSQEERSSIWRILSGILLLGNVTFVPGGGKNHAKVADKKGKSNIYSIIHSISG